MAMNEVKSWPWFCADGYWRNVVSQTDFDAERQARLEAERELSFVKEVSRNGQLISEELERQVAELRAQSEWRGEMAANNCREYEKQLVISHDLRTKLDTAMGLLRDLDSLLDTHNLSPGYDIEVRMSQVLNTTSTEGEL